MNEATAPVLPTTIEIKLTPEQEARFWSRVDKTGGPDACWNWTAGKNKKGYGQFWAGKIFSAHRVAWVLANGQIPYHESAHGLCVCHRCDNPPCMNPAHLFLGTNEDNMRDKAAKGRYNGSTKLSAEQVAEIRALYTAGMRKLATQFGVDTNFIGSITRRIFSTQSGGAFRLRRQ